MTPSWWTARPAISRRVGVGMWVCSCLVLVQPGGEEADTLVAVVGHSGADGQALAFEGDEGDGEGQEVGGPPGDGRVGEAHSPSGCLGAGGSRTHLYLAVLTGGGVGDGVDEHTFDEVVGVEGGRDFDPGAPGPGCAAPDDGYLGGGGLVVGVALGDAGLKEAGVEGPAGGGELLCVVADEVDAVGVFGGGAGLVGADGDAGVGGYEDGGETAALNEQGIAGGLDDIIYDPGETEAEAHAQGGARDLDLRGGDTRTDGEPGALSYFDARVGGQGGADLAGDGDAAQEEGEREAGRDLRPGAPGVGAGLDAYGCGEGRHNGVWLVAAEEH